jgi:hypothetical protein
MPLGTIKEVDLPTGHKGPLNWPINAKLARVAIPTKLTYHIDKRSWYDGK